MEHGSFNGLETSALRNAPPHLSGVAGNESGMARCSKALLAPHSTIVHNIQCHREDPRAWRRHPHAAAQSGAFIDILLRTAAFSRADFWENGRCTVKA